MPTVHPRDLDEDGFVDRLCGGSDCYSAIIQLRGPADPDTPTPLQVLVAASDPP